MPKPTIAMVNGHAVGAGLSLALACDIRIASDRAKLGTVFRNVGFSGDFGGSYLLQKLVGIGKARELYFTGEILQADAALAIGMVNRVVEHDRLEAETMELATRIASKSLPSLMATKGLLLDAERQGIVRARELENQAFAELLALPNARDGVLGQLD